MRKFMRFSKLMLLVMALSMFGMACGSAQKNNEQITQISELEHSTIAVWSGSICEIEARKVLPDAKYDYYNIATDILTAVQSGKADACVFPGNFIKALVKINDGLCIIDDSISSYPTIALFSKEESSQAFVDDFNEYLSVHRENGDILETINRWTDDPENVEPIEPVGEIGEKGTIVYAFCFNNFPADYLIDEKPAGYEPEIVNDFAKEYGYGLKIVSTEFMDIIPGLQTGKYDMATAMFEYSEEHAKAMLVSDTIVEEKLLVCVKDDSLETSSWTDKLKESLEHTFMTENRYRQFIEGFICTLEIMLLATILGTLLGLGMYMLYRKNIPGSKAVVRVFNAFIDATPMVVMLMIFYYVVFNNIGISNTAVAAFCFTLVFTSTVFGMLESSVKAIGTGQYEAAIALGYSDNKAFTRIVLPQALRIMLPGYQSSIIGMLKSTSIVGYIAVIDITKVTDIIRSRTFDAFVPLLAAALIYYILIIIIGFVISRLSIRIEPSKRSNKSILKGVKTDD